MYAAMEQINDGVNKIKQDGIRSITRPVMEGRRPDTAPLTKMWHDILRLRDEHKTLAQEHLNLTRENVERYVLQNRKR
jgi:hypothetical protein